MRLNYDIRRLKDNEIAGADTINPMVRFILGMKSQSEYLTINPDGMGSVNFDLDAESLLKIAQTFISQQTDGLNFDFRCTIGGSTSHSLSVSGGRVWFPQSGDVASISSYSHTLSSGDVGKMLYVRLTSKTSGTIVLDNAVTHTLQTGNDEYRVTLPIATITRSGENYGVRYHHIGSFALLEEPFFWKDGYDKSAYQFLVHRQDQNEERWVSASDCNEEGT